MTQPTPLFLLAVCVVSTTREEANESLTEITIDHANTEITTSVRVKRGSYHVCDADNTGVIIIKADGVTVDFNGASLVGCEDGATPDTFSGFAIVCRGYNNVTIKNARLKGFKVAIHVQGGENFVVADCDVSDNYAMRLKSTPEREDGADWLWPHYNDNNEWMTNYGAGIYVEDCVRATIRGNIGHHSQNGIILDTTKDSRVFDNDFSFNSGWGLGMWRSSNNEVSHNKFDWCVRGYSHGVYARGQDSAGVLIFEQCNDNVFAYNSATHGGDGFFLYAGNETLRQTGVGGCNRNLLFRNDFSHAVANGIEATFSDANRFIENILSDCNYGVWAGYSYNTWIAGNCITDSTDTGIAIEHGHDNVIEENVFENNRVGVRLWWNRNDDLMNSVYGQKQNTNSERNLIGHNEFYSDKAAVSLIQTTSTTIEKNAFVECGEDVGIEGDCPETVIRDNIIDSVEHTTANLFDVEITRPVSELVKNTSGFLAEQFANSLKVVLQDGKQGALEARRKLYDRFKPPVVSGSLDAFLPEGTRRGRKYIMVDEWGPYDFTAVKIFPKSISAGVEGIFHLYGPEGHFSVENVPDCIEVQPTEGEIPAKLTVRSTKDGLCVFDFDVRVAGEELPLKASGTLLNVMWLARFFHWDTDPRENQGAWDKLLLGEPVDEMFLSAINFAWGLGSPSEKVRPDYFGTLATTMLELPEGTYEIRTVSDDGIRVWVDGERVIDNWTWHVPTEDVECVTLEAGKHDFRIEHFEIDGWAVLSFNLHPVK